MSLKTRTRQSARGCSFGASARDLLFICHGWRIPSILLRILADAGTRVPGDIGDRPDTEAREEGGAREDAIGLLVALAAFFGHVVCAAANGACFGYPAAVGAVGKQV